MTETHFILGPPGTGKTTRLLRILNAEMEGGIDSKRIGYFSFTRSAASEARQRSGISEYNSQYFCTIHSMCYRMLGLSKTSVFGQENHELFSKMHGFSISSKHISTNDLKPQNVKNKGPRWLQFVDHARCFGRTLEEHYDAVKGGRNIVVREAREFNRIYTDFKDQFGVFDYTDILVQYGREGNGSTPELDVIIVDEAQDLSVLQWEVIDRMVAESGAQRVYVAGDDDQAIYRWASASVEEFLTRARAPGVTMEVLRQSYRVPASCHKLANKVIGQVKNRIPKVWRPTEATGSVDHIMHWEKLDFSYGTWLIIARDNYVLNQPFAYLTKLGLIFTRNGELPIPPGAFKAVKNWQRWQNGENLTDREKLQLKKFYLPEKRYREALRGEDALDLDWFEAFEKVTYKKRVLIQSFMKNDQDTSDVRIKLSTIHQAKGMEADNVLFFPTMSETSWKHQRFNHDDECRLLYVALTRARDRLYLVRPRSKFHYRI